MHSAADGNLPLAAVVVIRHGAQAEGWPLSNFYHGSFSAVGDHFDGSDGS